MRVGYVGLGDMGGALAQRLSSQHPAHVYDKSSAAVATLVNLGATPSASPAALAAACDVVLMCLPTSSDVRSVIFEGDAPLAAGLAPGALVIDQTTGNPKETARMATELAARGIDLVDAPVSGGSQGALAGTIAMMLGASDRVAARAIEVLQLIGPHVVHVGPVGSGQTMKLVNNLLSCTQRLVSLEALAIATKAGIEPMVAIDVLRLAGGRNAFLENQAHKVVAGEVDLAHGYSLALALKDLDLACQLAAEINVPTAYATLSRHLHQVAIGKLGGGVSVESIAGLVEAAADVRFNPSRTEADNTQLLS